MEDALRYRYGLFFRAFLNVAQAAGLALLGTMIYLGEWPHAFFALVYSIGLPLSFPRGCMVKKDAVCIEFLWGIERAYERQALTAEIVSQGLAMHIRVAEGSWLKRLMPGFTFCTVFMPLDIEFKREFGLSRY